MNAAVFPRALVLLGLVALLDCQSPCDELAHTICLCEATEAAQRTCTQTSDAQAARMTITDAQQLRCEDLLQSCSCEALAADDVAACGMARESL